MDWNTVEHFTKKEWEPNSDKVAPKLIHLLDSIRQEYGEVIIRVHCAFAQSGHSSNSYHYKGMAVDFHFEDKDYAKQFELLRSKEEIGGCGAYMEWAHPGWHIDLRPQRLYWTQRKGKYIYSLEAVLEDLRG